MNLHVFASLGSKSQPDIPLVDAGFRKHQPTHKWRHNTSKPAIPHLDARFHKLTRVTTSVLPCNGHHQGYHKGYHKGLRLLRDTVKASIRVALRTFDRNSHIHASARRLLRNTSMHIGSKASRFSWVFNVATQLAPKLYFGIPMCLPGEMTSS